MKIPPLPQAEGRKKPKTEPELVPGSALFRKHLESLAGLIPDEEGSETGDEMEDEVFGKEDAPKVKLRKKKAEGFSLVQFEPEKILTGLEAEEILDGIESATGLLNEPSILDLYRQRLVEHYGFSTDDPVFALCEIFDEVRRRDGERSAASEEFCNELMGRAEQALGGLREKSAVLESCLKEQQALQGSVGSLGKLVERVEEVVLSAKEEWAAHGASLSLVQRELERAVQQALQRGMVERLLMSVILVAALVVGMLAGSHLLH